MRSFERNRTKIQRLNSISCKKCSGTQRRVAQVAHNLNISFLVGLCSLSDILVIECKRCFNNSADTDFRKVYTVAKWRADTDQAYSDFGVKDLSISNLFDLKKKQYIIFDCKIVMHREQVLHTFTEVVTQPCSSEYYHESSVPRSRLPSFGLYEH